MGMTWRWKVQGFVVALMMLGLLALAAGADWIDW
jgi:hypothetical protein